MDYLEKDKFIKLKINTKATLKKVAFFISLYIMKPLLFILICFVSIYSCSSSKKTISEEKNVTSKANDTIKIASDDTEYEIIIIEPGFSVWLNTVARPEGFYEQPFLEIKNLQYVTEWNNRVSQPLRYDTNLYEMQINYLPGIDYGYEVNYKLYNYFLYFQKKYNQQLLNNSIRY